jgi:internalin A
VERNELLELIDRAACEGWAELDLHDQELTRLPPEVDQLTQLRSLDLQGNNLTSLPPEFGQLSKLQSLNLSWNNLAILPLEISQLSQLQSLNLDRNLLRALPPKIGQLTQLQSLSLGGNQLTELPPEISQLTHLQKLDLRSNKMEVLPSEICQLRQLQELNLGYDWIMGSTSNELTELPPEISQLTQLQKLDLSSNHLTLPREIWELTQLQSLNLGRIGLTALPPDISQLTQLQKLDLWHNQLITLPSEISQLSQLQSLNLGSNQLASLASEIGQLTQLRSLGLNGNELIALPPDLWKLTRLLSLYLNDNRLTNLPPEVGQLAQLQKLDLSNNQLTTLPPQIGRLSQLQSLNLWNNQLITLPPEIGDLSKLQELYVGENELTTLPPEIGQLASLTIFSVGPRYGRWGDQERTDISESYQAGKVTTLPLEIVELTNLTQLDLRYNPLPIPPEILAQTDDPQTIIDTYLEYLAGRSRPLNEVKMVLVGQGSVGKTSLVNRLLDDTFDPQETKTRGIDIRRWPISLPPPSPGAKARQEIHVNVWDFGGQEIMHATHQFFLTHRTLYLLVLDTRLSEAENRLDYWLQIIRSFGGKSPVILVGNKVDQQPLDIDQGGIRDKYPSIRGIVETSCVTGDGIDDLQTAIAEQIPTLPHVFDELLATWFDVKAELEELDADYIPYSHYKQMCQEAGVTKEQSQRTLLGFLHDLGIVLHFPDPRLETTNILNPEWVTQGVYRILNSHVLFQNGGVLTRELLAQILEDPKYPRDKHMFIVDMMRKFELCYPFPGQAHTYLVPDLLPKEERYTGEWDDALTFQIHYEILPGSVFSRFIVRMHRCIHQHTVWRTGVLLALDGNQALVRADLTDNRILIRVRGPAAGRRDLLTRIREQFDAIHHTIQGLQVEEKVPLPGHPELPPVDYDHLITLEQLGEETFIPQGLAERVSVRDLLNGVESPSTRRARDPERGSIVIQDSHIKHFGDNIAKPEERSRQMDPITGAIVAGLVSGAAEDLAAQAYQTLTAAIKKKHGKDSDLAEAVEKLEQRPESVGWREELETQVQATDAARDPELLALAERLITALEETRAGQQALGKYNVQVQDSQVGVIGPNAKIEGGIHFGPSGDTFNMSGDFRGAFLNIKSKLDNVTQTIGTLPQADASTKAELEELIKELNDALQQVPDDKAEDAEAVAQSAEMLVEKAAEEKPNKTMVQITGESLKQAAQNLADVTPTVLSIATQIVATVSKLVAQR